jgi:hypothetical protein
MGDADTIQAGKAAWLRVKSQGKVLFEDWLAIGRALIIGRRECMARAKCNSPYGPAYQKHMRAWLESNGLADIDTHERTGAIYMAEHQAEIERWREGPHGRTA